MSNAPEAAETWADWPCCPNCGQRRHAVCPVCHNARDDWSLADFLPPPAPLESTRSCCGSCEAPSETVDEGIDLPILLFCSPCDEAFPPQFYSTCQKCGHDFGEGLPAPPPEVAEENHRALLVMACLLLLAAAVLGYFWYLYRG